MRDLGIVKVNMKHFVGDVHVRVWEKGDEFPILGPTVGVDTETELITDTMKDPPVVVTGVFDPHNSNCWIVYWYDTVEFMRELNKRDIQQRYFNVGFDEQVLDNEDPEKTLLMAIDVGRVRDMQIRIHLHEIATVGWIRGNLYNLADCSLHFLNVTLDKGDPEDYENSARMTFRRFNPDGSIRQITDEQAVYLTYDCAATWGLGEAVREQPTEVEHTKGMVVLAHISTNGLQVDQPVFDAMEQKLFSARDEARQRLLTFGFPDPYKDAKKENAAERELFYSEYKKLCESAGLDCGLGMEEQTLDDEDETVIKVPKMPKKDALRLMICYLYNHSDAPDEIELCAENVKIVCEMEKPSMRKAAQTMYSQILEEYEILAFDQASKGVVMPSFVGHLMEHYNKQRESGSVKEIGYDFRAAVEYASDYLDNHSEWLTKTEQIGPRKFFQTHVKKIMEANPKLELETTPKSGDIKLTLKDKWRLEDNGIKDKFLDAYIDFNHAQKYLSTYMNRDFIKSDQRVHPRFTNILRTGRTSCSGPNAQNLPSRDKEFPLKNVYRPYDGMIMCATDFSFIELCGFAQSCFTRFGFSVMRDVINAGLDPHRWFAAVMDKVIEPDLRHANDPVWVQEMKDFLKKTITDAQRQKAKAANFGFPGALGVKTFYRNCRESGVKITMEDAEFMRNAWIDTFREMKYHMKPEKLQDSHGFGNQYGFRGDDDEDLIIDPSEQDRQLYRAKLINGMVRNRCTFNAACNMQFQGLVAYGAKLAGWNLVTHGYTDRIYNFVHDEYLYCLYPDELSLHIPVVEKLLVDGMRVAIPDVKVGVESSCMTHWDKKAVEFHKIQWDENGKPLIEEPPFVQEVLRNAC